MINWLTFGAGREPTKTILIPRRMRKRTGKVNRRILIFRGDDPFRGYLRTIIEEK